MLNNENKDKKVQKIEKLENLNIFMTCAINSFSSDLTSNLTYSIAQNTIYTSIGKNGTIRNYDANDDTILSDHIVSTFQLSNKIVPISNVETIIQSGLYKNNSYNFPTSNYYYSAPLFLQPISILQPNYFVIYGINKEDKSIKLFYFCNIYEKLLKELLDSDSFLKIDKIVNRFNEFNSGIYSIDSYSYQNNSSQSIIKYFSGKKLNFDSSFENQSVIFDDIKNNSCFIPNILDINYYFKIDSNINLDEYEIIGEYIIKNELNDVSIDIEYLNEKYDLNIKNDIYFPPGLEISEFKVKEDIPYNKTNYYIFENQEFETIVTVDADSILKSYEDFKISDILGAAQSDVTIAKIKNLYEKFPSNFLISLKDDIDSNSNCFVNGSKISILDNDIQYNIIFKDLLNNTKCGICESVKSCHFPKQKITFNTDNILFESDSAIEFILPNYVDIDEYTDIKFSVGNYSDIATIFKVRKSFSKNETRFNLYFNESSYKKIKREYLGLKWYFTYDKKERYDTYINTLENLSNISIIKSINDSILNFYNYCDLTVFSTIREDNSLLLVSTSGDYESGAANKEIRFILSKNSDISSLYLNNIKFKGVNFSRLSQSRFNYSICDFVNYCKGTIHIEIDKKYLSEFIEKDAIAITLAGSMDYQRYKQGQEYIIAGSNEDINSIIVSIPNAYSNYFSKSELIIGEHKHNKISIYDIAPIYQEIVSTLRYTFINNDNDIKNIVSCEWESSFEFNEIDNEINVVFPCKTETTTTFKLVDNSVFSIVPCFNTIVDSFEHLDNDVGYITPCLTETLNEIPNITTDLDYNGECSITTVNVFTKDENDINIITPCLTETTTSQTFFFNAINNIVPCWNYVNVSFKSNDIIIPNIIPCETESTTIYKKLDNDIIEIIPCDIVSTIEYILNINQVINVIPCYNNAQEDYIHFENLVTNVISCYTSATDVYIGEFNELENVIPCYNDISYTYIYNDNELDYNENSTIINKNTFETNVNNITTIIPCYNDIITTYVDGSTQLDYNENVDINVNTGYNDKTTILNYNINNNIIIKNTFVNKYTLENLIIPCNTITSDVYVGEFNELENVIPCETISTTTYTYNNSEIDLNIDSQIISNSTYIITSNDIINNIPCETIITTTVTDHTTELDYNGNTYNLTTTKFVSDDINVINVIPCYSGTDSNYEDSTTTINYNIDTQITSTVTYNDIYNITIESIPCETEITTTFVGDDTELDYNGNGKVDINTGWNDGTTTIDPDIDSLVINRNTYRFVNDIIEVIPCDTITSDVWTSDENKVFNIIPCETIITTTVTNISTELDYNGDSTILPVNTFTNIGGDINYDGNNVVIPQNTFDISSTPLDYNIDGKLIVVNTFTINENDVNVTIPCETIVSESYNDSTTVLDYDASSYRITDVTYIGTDTTIDYNSSSYVDINTGWNNYSTQLDYNIDSTRFTTVTYESDENDVNVVIPTGTEISTNVVDKTTTINFNVNTYRLVKYTYVGSTSEIDVDIDGGIDITHKYEYVFNNVEVTIPCETIISESYQDSTTELDFNGNTERDILNTFTERTISTDYNENSWVDVNVGYTDGTNPLDYNSNSTIITKNDFTVIQTDVDFDGNNIITVLNTVGNTTTLDYSGNTWLDVNVGYVDGSTGVDYDVETSSITRITFVGNDNEIDVDIDGGISVKQVYNDVEIISECVIPCETISSSSYVEHTNEIDYNGDSTINVLNSTGTSTAIDYNGSGYVDVNTGWNDGTTGSDFDIQGSVTVLNSVGVTSSIDFDNIGSVIIANSYPNISTNVDYDGNNIITKVNIFENISSETDFDNSSYRLTLNTFEDNDPTTGTNEIDLSVDTYIQYINPNYSQVDENTREAKNGDLDIILKRVEGGCYSAESWTANTVGGIFPTKSKQKVIETEFYMSETLITQQMWKLVMEGNTNGIMLKPVEDPEFAANQNLVENATYGDNKPVYNISFYEAIVFCNRLSMMFGKEPLYTIMGSKDPDDWGTVPNYNDSSWNNVDYDFDADGFGLPSMSQWFYAAYEGNASAYSRYTKFNQPSGYFFYDNYRYNSGNSGYSCVYPAYKGVDSFTISPSTNQTLIHNVKSYTANNLGLYDMLTEVNMLSFDIKRPTVYSYIDEQNRGWYPISELGRLVIDETAYSNNQQSITVGESTDTIPVPNPITIPEEYTYLEGWPINYMPYKEYIDHSGLVDCTNSINNYRGIIPAYMSRTTYYEPFTNGQPVLPGNINVPGSYYISNYAPDTIFNYFDTKQTFIDFMLNNNGINYCGQAIESSEDSKYTTNDLNSNLHFNQWNSMSNTIRNEISRTDMYNKLWTPNCSGISQNELELQYMNSLKTGNYDDIQNKNGFRIVQNVPSSYSEFDTYNIHNYSLAEYKDYLKTYIMIRKGSNIVLLNKIDSGDFES